MRLIVWVPPETRGLMSTAWKLLDLTGLEAWTVWLTHLYKCIENTLLLLAFFPSLESLVPGVAIFQVWYIVDTVRRHCGSCGRRQVNWFWTDWNWVFLTEDILSGYGKIPLSIGIWDIDKYLQRPCVRRRSSAGFNCVKKYLNGVRRR